MNKALLDTDIISEIGKAKNATVAGHAKTYRRSFGHYTLSAVSGGAEGDILIPCRDLGALGERFRSRIHSVPNGTDLMSPITLKVRQGIRMSPSGPPSGPRREVGVRAASTR